jgi:hypothetical protein
MEIFSGLCFERSRSRIQKQWLSGDTGASPKQLSLVATALSRKTNISVAKGILIFNLHLFCILDMGELGISYQVMAQYTNKQVFYTVILRKPLENIILLENGLTCVQNVHIHGGKKTPANLGKPKPVLLII